MTLNQPGDPIRVLHVDDDPDFVEMAATFVERADDRFGVETATGAIEGYERLTEGDFDCVVSDFDMPAENGIEFLEAVREEYPDLPFILFTGKGSEAVASDAISAGVTDYLQKQSGTSQYEMLAHRIVNAVERYRSRRAVEAAEQKLSLLAEKTDDILFMFDGDWSELRFINSAYEEIWGGSVAELEDDPGAFLEFIHPEDRERARRSMERLSNGTPDEIEYRVVRPDGTRRWVRGESKPVFDDDGNVVRIVGWVRDVTEHKRSEREYERVLELLNHTEQIADVGGWEIDTETDEVFWSDHLFEMLGGAYEEEPPLADALDIYLDEDRPRVENAIEEALAAGEPFDVDARFRRPDGEVRWFQILGEPTVEDGEVVTLRGAVQDITTSKEWEARLRETTSRLEALFENSPDMIDVLDPEGTLVDANRRFCEALGYDEDEVLGRPIWEIDRTVDADDVTELLADFDPHERRMFEGVYERRDGSTFPVEVHLLRLDLDGEDRFVAISRDITDRKASERELEQQNQQLEEFATAVSHDLRNPLNVAQGRLELARAECEGEHLAGVDDALERSQALIDDLLALAREGEMVSEVEAVDLGALAEDCWGNVTTAGATVTVETTRTIHADRSRLQQLLENLYRNAVEHGSIPRSDTREDAVEHGSTGSRPVADDAVEHGGDGVAVTVGDLPDGFYIEDDGSGIPRDERASVFDVGYSSADGGTGFGLSIVDRIADAHGWAIQVTDGPDGGARFELSGVTTVE